MDEQRFFETPILFMIFKRPQATEKVFQAIKKVEPKVLYVAADGPRDEKEKEKCLQTREIINGIDWKCEVKTLYREKNLGCKMAVSSAIDWFFDSVESGIILEDDCVPHKSFFYYCEELLGRYKDDNRIFAITGTNLQKQRNIPYSYYFSKHLHVWGWATWKRVWKQYDKEMKLWPTIKEKKLLCELYPEKFERKYWTHIFDKVYNHGIDTWDYQLSFLCKIHNALIIAPQNNLISNIGFHMEATHTKTESDASELPTKELLFPLTHPPFVIRDVSADTFTDKHHYHITLRNFIKEKCNYFIFIIKRGILKYIMRRKF